MISPLIIPPYAGNIQYYSLFAHSKEVLLEKNAHYVKQTYRNSWQILTANGGMNLTSPVEKVSG